MNTLQKLVVLAVLALIALNYLFPYTQYPVTESSPDKMRSTTVTKTTFMPIWEARAAHEQAPLKGNVFSDTITLWPTVHLFTGLVVAFGVTAYLKLRTKPSNTPPTT